MWRIRIGGIFALLALLSCSAWSQNAVFSVNASADKMGVKDQIQVDYTIQNVPNLRSINNPHFEDFLVVSGPFSRQSSSISVVNNKMVQSVSVTYSYVLQPKKTGTLNIPATTAKDAAGQTYQSNSLKIDVVNGSLARQQQRQQATDPFDDPFFQDPFAAMARAQQQRMAMMRQHQQQAAAQRQQPQAADENVNMNDVYKNIFMRVIADKTTVHVGEQVTVTYKLYTRIPMNAGISKLPSLNGFWTQDFEIAKGGAMKPVEEVIDGKTFQVFTVKKSALFPQQVGTLTLDPAEAKGTARIIQRSRQQDPFGDMFADDPFFKQFIGQMMQDPFSGSMYGAAYKDVPVTMTSKPLKITVLPLPEEGKPQDFGNAVGNFTLEGKADKTKMTTDDVLTYTLKIRGSGNLKLIEAPALKLPNGLSSFDPTILDTITGRTTTISGAKIITYSIAANLPGDYELPAIPFSYYNPQTGKYTTLYTQPLKIQVAKGKHYNPSLAQNNLTDIHPIVNKPLKSLSYNSRPLLFKAGYWSLYAIPMLAFIGLLVWRKREEEFSKDTVRLRNRRANKIALKRLSTAKKLLQQNQKAPFYEEISKALWLYISDKLNIPLSALSREKAHEGLLQTKNVQAGLLTRIDTVMNDCETTLYAPNMGAQHMQKTYEETIDIISKLEEVI
jgi:hypothetical protein